MSELLKSLQSLQVENLALTSSLSAMKASCQIELLQLSRDLNTTLFEKAKLEFHIEANEKKHVDSLQLLLDSHKLEMEKLRTKSEIVSHSVTLLQKKIERMKLTPYGYRSQIRARKDLHALLQTGGHAKAQRRLVRWIPARATV